MKSNTVANTTIRRAAVLGAGVMGARIAAHLANAGIPSYLLDILPKELTEKEKTQGLTLDSPEVRNKLALAGLENAKKSKPAAFFDSQRSSLITVGNFEDDLKCLGEVDWIIEAIVERAEAKQELYQRVELVRKKGSIVSSNTSGIAIGRLGKGRSEEFRQHLVGTHFFNPPRYLKLLEIIPTRKTLPQVIATVAAFGEKALGKGIVYCKDTPNFIANRIGVFAMLYTMRSMIEGDYSIEEVDQITGPASGKPKSATFRTADLVGLDTIGHVANNLYEAVPNDERRDVLVIPDFVKVMAERKWLGDKTGQGFYKKVKEEGGRRNILTLDYKAMEYRPREKSSFPSLEIAKNIEDVAERIKMLANSEDRAGKFFWKTLSAALIYTANRIPEISDDIVNIDNAMKWGFNWDLGPFETWDAIGVEESAEKMRREGQVIPPLVEKLLSSGEKSFYKKRNGTKYFFDVTTARHIEQKEPVGLVLLRGLKEQNKVVKSNAGASLIDLGDGVACLEFHSKMNAIGQDILEMIAFSLAKVGEDFEGLVVGNEGPNFSVGANLMMVLMAAQEEEWEELDMMVRQFQRATMSLRYSPKPVVVAPFGMTLGGGCEVALHADRVRASAELYMGLVEVGVGVIPAGGGTKEMLLRNLEGLAIGEDDVDLFPFVKRAFETIGLAKVSSSALEAKHIGYLRETDGITMNKDHLLADAKNTILGMVKEGYTVPIPRTKIPVLGESALATLKLGMHMMKSAGRISDHDMMIGTKIAHVLCGGAVTSKQFVSEQYLLDLEREAFLSLCGQPKTQERIAHMLKNGKPLRN